MREWNLREHGDAEERDWWPSIEAHFPNYEVFWRKHVVPLTCRVVNPDNIFMRPSVPDHLSDLGNTNYSVFWHLAGACQDLHARDWSAKLPRRLGSFYGSLVSAGQDACYKFLRATNKILDTYGPTYISSRERRLSRYGDEDLASDHENILETIKVYRTQLFHLGVFVVIEGMIPRREWLVQYDDLRRVLAILASPNRAQIVGEHFVNPMSQCHSDLEVLASTLDRIWAVVLREFEEIAELDRYQYDQSGVSDADRTTCSFQWARSIVSYASTSGSCLVTPSGVAMFPADIDDRPGHQ